MTLTESGSPTPPSLRAAVASEQGSLTAAHIVFVCVVLLLFSLLANTGTQVNGKVALQAASDSAAVAGADWYARGLNELTATNHCIGEMTAMLIVHNSVGGDRPGESPKNTDRIDRTLSQVQRIASRLRLRTHAYSTVRQQIRSDGMLFPAKRNLKQLLTRIYELKILAILLRQQHLLTILDLIEDQILREHRILDQFEQRAIELSSFSSLLESAAIPQAVLHTRRVVGDTPQVARSAAAIIAKRNGHDGGICIRDLPVMLDPLSGGDRGTIGRTQLVRAASPFVNFHQAPVHQILGWLPLSEAASYFRESIVETTKSVAERMARNGVALYVLVGTNLPQKGRERWTVDTDQADSLFAIVGWATDAPRSMVAQGVFRQSHPDGHATFSQALFYNANRQEAGETGDRQAIVGWDTLNWNTAGGRSSPPEFNDRFSNSEGRPEVMLNWQSLLVPLGKTGISIARADPTLPPNVRRIVARAPWPFPAPLMTH